MKKIVMLALVSALLAANTAVLADNMESAENTADTVLISTETTDAAENEVTAEDTENTEPAYLAEEETVAAIGDETITFEDGCVINKKGTVVFSTTGEEKSVSDIKVGDAVSTYVPSNRISDEYYVTYMIIGDGNAAATIDEFKVSETLGEFVNPSNTLALTIGDDTKIESLDGTVFTKESLAGRVLLVCYDYTTMSIPAITNPTKVIVLTEPLTDDENNDTDGDSSKLLSGDDAMEIDGISYLPLRKCAEAMGYEVKWTSNSEPIEVGTMQMGVSVTIGRNSYPKSKMTPFVLDGAPVLVESTTYVPVSFFEEVLEAEVVTAGTDTNTDTDK